MKFQLTTLMCAMALSGCAGQAAKDRLGIEDLTVIKTGIGASQDTAAGAVTPQWLSTYAPIVSSGEAYNQKLSLQRALTVKAYLVKRGVTLPITVTGQGKSNPLVECTQTNRDELVNCLAPNRRVEIDFVRDEG